MGGFIGTISRYFSTVLIQKFIRNYFYAGTLGVNLIGSFVIGILGLLFLKESLHPGYRLFFITGILGGFTTFSSFSLESLKLIQEGRTLEAFLYITGSVTGGLLFAFAGWQVGRFISD